MASDFPNKPWIPGVPEGVPSGSRGSASLRKSSAPSSTARVGADVVGRPVSPEWPRVRPSRGGAYVGSRHGGSRARGRERAGDSV